MRDSVREVVTKQIITLQGVAEHFGEDPVLIYRYVVRDRVCEFERIGRSHVVIDREDMELVRKRLEQANTYKANRKKD